MNPLSIENNADRLLISIDKKLISTDVLADIIRYLELEALAQQIDFDADILALGNTIKQDWWQQNKSRLLTKPCRLGTLFMPNTP